MKKLPSMIVAFLMPWLAAGCSVFSESQGIKRQYVLGDDIALNAAPGPTTNARLLVRPTTADPFINTYRIVFSREPGTRAYYQFSTWTQSPTTRFTDLLIHVLQQAGIFRSVTAASKGTAGALLLDTDIFEFYHDAVESPGTVRVGVRAQLIDRRDRSIMAQETFQQSVPVPSYDAAGAVAGFNQAVRQILEDMTAWIGRAISEESP